jgi:hypothetical protein
LGKEDEGNIVVSAGVEVLINSNMPGTLVAFANIDITKHS